MKKDDARQQVLSEWRRWASAAGKDKATGQDGFAFYFDLQRTHSHLLNFRDSGDRWQTVHAWLLAARLVSD